MANSYEMSEIMGFMSDEYEENVKAFQEACQASKAVKFVEAGSEVDLTGWQKLVLEYSLKETEKPEEQSEPEAIQIIRKARKILATVAQKASDLADEIESVSNTLDEQGWDLEYAINTYEAE